MIEYSLMNKDLFIYFLILVVPFCVLPFATHRLLTAEIVGGRRIGNAYLQAKAELCTHDAVRTNGVWKIDLQDDKLMYAIVGADGNTLSPWPEDNRCHAEATLPKSTERVRVAWSGNPSPGAQRRQKLHRAEAIVWTFSAALSLVGIFLIFRAIIRSRSDAKRQLDYVRDFSHRLKTPLTSISLCAELSHAGRLSDEQRNESVNTIISEAVKLNGIVDEVLDYVKGCRHD